ncbi:hypothetical protein, partial [Pseudomonas syringae group genomosp. 7]|uniref:hypothetical protein n=1 Tax=Pseudomonas syringae group genomosp. 7 TaxID=251699 RepID=UPI00376F8CE0
MFEFAQRNTLCLFYSCDGAEVEVCVVVGGGGVVVGGWCCCVVCVGCGCVGVVWGWVFVVVVLVWGGVGLGFCCFEALLVFVWLGFCVYCGSWRVFLYWFFASRGVGGLPPPPRFYLFVRSCH